MEQSIYVETFTNDLVNGFCFALHRFSLTRSFESGNPDQRRQFNSPIEMSAPGSVNALGADLITTIIRRVHFSAAHTYSQPSRSFGHNFKLEACFQGPVDPLTGMIINLSDIDHWLKELLVPLDHHYLNQDVEFFKTHVPTAENIARYCFESLQEIMQKTGARNLPQSLANGTRLTRVRLHEGENLWVDYSDQAIEDD